MRSRGRAAGFDRAACAATTALKRQVARTWRRMIPTRGGEYVEHRYGRTRRRRRARHRPAGQRGLALACDRSRDFRAGPLLPLGRRPPRLGGVGRGVGRSLPCACAFLQDLCRARRRRRLHRDLSRATGCALGRRCGARRRCAPLCRCLHGRVLDRLCELDRRQQRPSRRRHAGGPATLRYRLVAQAHK
jgi:hypothetical protein